MSLLELVWQVLCWIGGITAVLILLALAADFVLQLEGRTWRKAEEGSDEHLSS